MNISIRRSLLFVGMALVFAPAGHTQGDVAVPPWWRSPANAWMKVPMAWSPHSDSVLHSLRSQRDTYFDSLIGLPSPLTPDNAKTVHFTEGSTVGSQPEIPNVRDRAVLIGTFATHQAVLTASGRAIYTEIHFRASNFFQDAGVDVNARPRSDVTLILPGGTVKTDTGMIISFLTDPRQYFLTPGKNYLLVASYHASGDYYMLSKSWDLSDGLVRANFVEQSKDRSTLIGLTVNQLIAVLPATMGIH